MSDYLAIPRAWLAADTLEAMGEHTGKRLADARAVVVALAIHVDRYAPIKGEVDEDRLEARVGPKAMAALRAADLVRDGQAVGWYDAVGVHSEEHAASKELARIKKRTQRDRARREALGGTDAEQSPGDVPGTGRTESEDVRGPSAVVPDVSAPSVPGTSGHTDLLADRRTYRRTSPADRGRTAPRGGPPSAEAVTGELVAPGPRALATEVLSSNWVVRLTNVMVQRKGGTFDAHKGQVMAWCKPLVTDHGVEAVELAMVEMCVVEPPQFANPKRLAENFGVYAGTHPAGALRPAGNGKRPPGSLPLDIFDSPPRT